MARIGKVISKRQRDKEKKIKRILRDKEKHAGNHDREKQSNHYK